MQAQVPVCHTKIERRRYPSQLNEAEINDFWPDSAFIPSIFQCLTTCKLPQIEVCMELTECCRNFPAAEKSEKRGERKGLSRRIRSWEHLFHPGYCGDTQGSKKKAQQAWGAHIKLLGEGAGPVFLARGKMGVSASCDKCSHHALLCSSQDSTLRGKVKKIRANPSPSHEQLKPASPAPMEPCWACRDAHRWWAWLRPPEPGLLQTLPMADTVQPGDSSKGDRNELEETMKPQENNREKMAPFLTWLRKQGLPPFATEATWERSGLFRSQSLSCQMGAGFDHGETGKKHLHGHPGHLCSHIQCSLPLTPKLVI